MGTVQPTHKTIVRQINALVSNAEWKSSAPPTAGAALVTAATNINRRIVGKRTVIKVKEGFATQCGEEVAMAFHTNRAHTEHPQTTAMGLATIRKCNANEKRGILRMDVGHMRATTLAPHHHFDPNSPDDLTQTNPQRASHVGSS